MTRPDQTHRYDTAAGAKPHRSMLFRAIAAAIQRGDEPIHQATAPRADSATRTPLEARVAKNRAARKARKRQQKRARR